MISIPMAIDPWEEMSRAAPGSFTVRRVDPSHPYDFYWGRDGDGRSLLVLRHSVDADSGSELPKLKGMEVSRRKALPGERAALLLTLRKSEDREIFYRLCSDIVETTRACGSDKAATDAAVRRTWKWHALLAGEADGRLGPSEQQGLVGELLVLESLFEAVGMSKALDAWRGPLGDPKDFILNGCAIEAKARQGGRPFVRISSEHQLAQDAVDKLFLAVTEISAATASVEDAVTLDAMVQRVEARIEAVSPGCFRQFEGLLAAAGYTKRHMYDDRWWLVIEQTYYSVVGRFPRIIPSALAEGVGEVAYSLAIASCAPFVVDASVVFSAVRGKLQ